MRFDPPLIPARLVRRYKRFLADVEMGGAIMTAHCPNPGSMLGLADPGTPVWVSKVRVSAARAGRKLPYTLELVESGNSLVSVHTGRTNALVAEALARRGIAALAPYRQWRREVRIEGGSRLDFLFEGQDLPPLYLEVKSVTLRRSLAEPATAEFPDAVTARGARHMRDLAGLAAAGYGAAVLFLVQRPDCQRFQVASDIDSAYAQALAAAQASGVEVLCYGCTVSPAAIEVSGPLPVTLS
ncbi:MAG: DNA/RNA nuclease SfsA [Alphaproteobacteria bacterium]